MAVFSFHPVKQIASGEGGMIVTNNLSLYRELIRLRSHGITKLNDRFRSSDTIEKAAIDEIEMNFLYQDEIDYYFINQKTFEQINLKKI